MFLYNLTLQRSTGITHAIHGNFSGTKQQEIIVSRGKLLELLRPDPNTGKVYTLLTTEVFGVIRALMPFRLTGGSKGKTNLCLLCMCVCFCISDHTYKLLGEGIPQGQFHIKFINSNSCLLPTTFYHE